MFGKSISLSAAQLTSEPGLIPVSRMSPGGGWDTVSPLNLHILKYVPCQVWFAYTYMLKYSFAMRHDKKNNRVEWVDRSGVKLAIDFKLSTTKPKSGLIHREPEPEPVDDDQLKLRL